MADAKEPPSQIELLERLLVVAEEQLRWQKAAVLPSVRATAEATLSSEAMRRAYELGDGTRSSADVAAEVGVSRASLSGWSRRWRDLGIATEVGPGRRIRHLVSLRSLGIPELPEQ